LNIITHWSNIADIFVPSFDNSAMDGYALNLKEEQINISGGTTFKRLMLFQHTLIGSHYYNIHLISFSKHLIGLCLF
jgi:hypothetical protein